MKKYFLALLLLFFPLVAHAQLKVVGTLPVFASLAQEIGGDRVQVTSLARGNQDPHFLDAKPSFVVALNKADMLVYGGLDLEVGWLPTLLTQASNDKILPGNLGNVNAAQGLTILEIPKTKMDRSFGDVHPLGNPHAWLDPHNAKLIAANIYQHLVQLDPEGKSYYENRLKAFLGKLNQKMIQWESILTQLRGKKVLTYHRSFTYLAHWTGMEIVDTVESKPGIAPSSKHVDDLIKLIPAEQVKAILVESFYPQKVPKFLSEKTNIPMLIIPSDTGELGIQNYIQLIDYILAELQKAL